MYSTVTIIKANKCSQLCQNYNNIIKITNSYMFRALLDHHQRVKLILLQLRAFIGLKYNSWIVMHGMEYVKNDVMSHKTINFNKHRCEDMGSSIYLLLDKEISPKWKNGVKLHTFLTLVLHWRAWKHYVAVWIREKRVLSAQTGGWVHPTPGVLAVASIAIPAFVMSRAAAVQTLTIQFTDWYIPHNFCWIHADNMFYLMKFSF
jgi:hypothetical protein